jgi:hypothetical protein
MLTFLDIGADHNSRCSVYWSLAGTGSHRQGAALKQEKPLLAGNL